MALQRLLLLSGAMRSGKSSVAQILKKNYAFSGISSGEYLREHIAQRAGRVIRSGLQDLGDQLDQETDFAWIVDRVAIPALEAAPTVKNWLLDAVRKPRQIEHFRARFLGVVRHVHLQAPESILEARYMAEAATGDPLYALVIKHPNEVAARSLGFFADRIFDTEEASAIEIAKQIGDLWEE